MRTETRIVLALAGLWAGVTAGCGSSSSSDGNGGDNTSTAQAFAAQFGQAICARVYRCCNAADLLSMSVLSEAECQGFSSGTFGVVGDLAKALDDKRATYNPAKAAACVSGLKTTACGPSDLFDNPKRASVDCAAAVTGQVAIGGACKSGWDCVGLGSCSRDLGATVGKCVTDGKSGDACVFSPDCRYGLYCANAYKCAPTKANGAGCFSHYECAGDACVHSQCATAPAMCTGT